MLPGWTRRLLALTLALTIGLHWAVLQSAAWAGMFVSHWRTVPLAAAIQRTFDGKHPCQLCKAVAAGRQSERKASLTLDGKKLELISDPEIAWFVGPPPFRLLRVTDTLGQGIRHEPPTPPPRAG